MWVPWESWAGVSAMSRSKPLGDEGAVSRAGAPAVALSTHGIPRR